MQFPWCHRKRQAVQQNMKYAHASTYLGTSLIDGFGDMYGHHDNCANLLDSESHAWVGEATSVPEGQGGLICMTYMVTPFGARGKHCRKIKESITASTTRSIPGSLE